MECLKKMFQDSRDNYKSLLKQKKTKIASLPTENNKNNFRDEIIELFFRLPKC